MSNEISPFKQSAVSEGMPASPPSTYPFRKISLLRRQSYSAAELHSIPINPALTPADQARRSGRIDAQLTKEAKERQKAVRYEVVLLGPGDSGKTTFLRQVTIFYGVAFTQDEYQDYKWGIIRNIRKNFLTLYLALELTGNLEKYLHEHAAYEKCVSEMQAVKERRHALSSADIALIARVWSFPEIQTFAKANASKFALDDQIQYFFGKVEEVVKDDYVPNTEDILRARIPNENIIERVFEANGATMQFYDVAGQKEKRQRWVPYMQSRLSAIIYVTSIASYDQRMEEDRTVNRYVDALVLFESIMQNPLLKGVQTIVMLNKVDIFEEKIKVVDFKTHIHHYNGKNTSKDVIKFISEEFKRKNQEVQRKVIVHLTTGTDIKLMKGIIKSIQYISFTQENHPKSSA